VLSERNSKTRRIPISKYPFTPATYPGHRPLFSFLFTQEGIYRLKVNNLGRFLTDRGLRAATERYAILAYGSNACPGQLQEKQRKYGLKDVPVLYGRLLGAEAVHAGRTAKRGYVPATLARKNGSGPNWITLLDAEQFQAMDESEGRPTYYELVKLPTVRFSVGHFEVSPVYAYVNIRGGVMTIGGKPASPRTTNQKEAKSQVARAGGEDAALWLEYEVIPYPNQPGRYSQFFKRWMRF
jgi:hypothetical protein